MPSQQNIRKHYTLACLPAYILPTKSTPIHSSQPIRLTTVQTNIRNPPSLLVLPKKKKKPSTPPSYTSRVIPTDTAPRDLLKLPRLKINSSNIIRSQEDRVINLTTYYTHILYIHTYLSRNLYIPRYKLPDLAVSRVDNLH